MSTVRVAIPVFFGKRKFYLDKGRSWSVVEHLILAALNRAANGRKISRRYSVAPPLNR
jgi:hypothetical protein